MNRFQAWYHAQPRALRALLTINVVAYVLWILLFAHIDATAAFVLDHLALNARLPKLLYEPWQLITYNFLHIGPGFWGFLHILFNLWWLVILGREYEEMHGPHQLLGVYLLTGIGGGLVTLLMNLLLPASGLGGGFVHGASASVLGVSMAVAITYPYKQVALIFLPPIRLLYLVLAFLALDLIFLLGGDRGTAVGAHLGGVFFGFLIAFSEQRGLDLTGWARVFFRERRRSAPAQGTMLERLEAWLSRRQKPERPAYADVDDDRKPRRRFAAFRPDESKSAVPQDEIDRILEKISEHGMEALTEEEKRILYEASRR